MESLEGVSLARLLATLREMRPESLARLDIARVVRDLTRPSPEASEPAGEVPPRREGYFGAVARLVAELADGLASARARGIFRGEPKAQDVLLDRRLSPRLTVPRESVGAPPDASPGAGGPGRHEADRGADVDFLGVTLFELLTLSLPFSGDSPEVVSRRIAVEGPPSLRRLNPDVPRDLDVIARKAMENDPDRRYGDAAEMAEDLRRFLRFEPIEARLPGPAVLVARFLRRHRAAAAAASALVVAGVPVAATVRHAKVEDRIREVDAEVRRRLEEAEGHLRAAEESETAFALAARAFESALHLREDPEIRARRDAALGFFPVTITSDPPGARVTLHPTGDRTGAILPGKVLGETPVRDAVLRLGAHRLLVEKPGFGFGEYTLAVKRGDEDRRLDAVLRRTEEVLAGMVLIPGGSYPIGQDPASGGENAPRPAAVVEVEPFYIDPTEVTNEEYARFLRETGRDVPAIWKTAGGTFPAKEERHPVVGVTWHDAVAFAEWAGKRLPTETEWEVACRGTDQRLYPWGNEFDPDRARVNLSSEHPDPGAKARSEPVDSRPQGRSPFGLFHMLGNANEWVWDLWAPRGGSRGASRPQPSEQHVFRGGSWRWPPQPCFMRDKMAPGLSAFDLGFRCAKSAPP